LRVTFETTNIERPLAERTLTVVPKGRMAQIMGEARGIDNVRIEPEARGKLTSHLSHLERMRESVSSKIEAGRWAENLRLGREPSEGARMQ
jgi:hypothetical protein